MYLGRGSLAVPEIDVSSSGLITPSVNNHEMGNSDDASTCTWDVWNLPEVAEYKALNRRQDRRMFNLGQVAADATKVLRDCCRCEERVPSRRHLLGTCGPTSTPMGVGPFYFLGFIWDLGSCNDATEQAR